jgi:very-short-patch-repair endonuclease
MRPRRIDMRGGSAMTVRARNLRSNLTDAERVLWRELRQHQLGWRFRRQFPIPPYVADFACIEAHLIVEVDGGQHATPGDHDRRDQRLRAQGWSILRFWNNDVLGNRAGVLQTIAEALGTRHQINLHPNPPPLAGEGVSVATRLVQSPPQIPPPSKRRQITAAKTMSPPPQAGEG